MRFPTIRTALVFILLLFVAPSVVAQVPIRPPENPLSARTPETQETLLLAANDCNGLLAGGVFDQLRLRTASDIRLAIFQWQCTTDFRTHDEAINAGLSVGFPVYGVPLRIGGTFSQVEKDTWRREHCSTNSVSLTDTQTKELEILVASKDILATYTRCIESTSFGLSMRLAQK